MRCQRCDKPATFHITELTSGQPQELHLCEEHAREYLSHPGEEAESTSSMAAALAQHMIQQMVVGQTAEELERLDRQKCPVCGITFRQFRSLGRLGCPNDYDCFEKQLEALIVNIHSETEHTGKRPTHLAEETAKRTRLISLRRQMREAIEAENYERAGELRDEIRRIESGG